MRAAIVAILLLGSALAGCGEMEHHKAVHRSARVGGWLVHVQELTTRAVGITESGPFEWVEGVIVTLQNESATERLDLALLSTRENASTLRYDAPLARGEVDAVRVLLTTRERNVTWSTITGVRAAAGGDETIIPVAPGQDPAPTRHGNALRQGGTAQAEGWTVEYLGASWAQTDRTYYKSTVTVRLRVTPAAGAQDAHPLLRATLGTSYWPQWTLPAEGEAWKAADGPQERVLLATQNERHPSGPALASLHVGSETLVLALPPAPDYGSW